MEVDMGPGAKAGVGTDLGAKTQKPRFSKLQDFPADYSKANVTLYKSDNTGMRVIVVNREGPKICGTFALATEIFDDSGAPHTLEHLVFMGSKTFPYSGLLDKMATRAYAYTNAYTAVDHTAYILETAGWEGFAQILPVYLEHVMLPRLTNEACMTEVHHVDGKGEDAGVVYAEMQALQYTSKELMDLRARRLLYPEDVGFRYETGGMMDALRVLTPQRIREFHKTMYQLPNLAVVVVGDVDQAHLLDMMETFENAVVENMPPLDTPFKRPWVETPQPPPLAETVIETVEFPEEDESMGEIAIGFLGPSCTDTIASTALDAILSYLCGSSASILENVLVEKEELASAIMYEKDDRPDTLIWLLPSGVATDKLAHVEQRLISLIRQTLDEPLDMSYMRDSLRREKMSLTMPRRSRRCRM